MHTFSSVWCSRTFEGSESIQCTFLLANVEECWTIRQRWHFRSVQLLFAYTWFCDTMRKSLNKETDERDYQRSTLLKGLVLFKFWIKLTLEKGPQHIMERKIHQVTPVLVLQRHHTGAYFFSSMVKTEKKKEAQSCYSANLGHLTHTGSSDNRKIISPHE